MTKYTRRHRSACLRWKQGGESRFEKRAGGFVVWPQNHGRTRGVRGTIAKLMVVVGLKIVGGLEEYVEAKLSREGAGSSDEWRRK